MIPGLWRFFSVLAIGVMALVAFPARAETLVEYSAETRFQLDLHVPDAALAAMLPSGWTPNIASQGPAKDANLRAIFVDRLKTQERGWITRAGRTAKTCA